MKRTLFITLATLTLMLTGNAFARSANDVLAKAEKVMQVPSSYMVYEQTSAGGKDAFRIEEYAKANGKKRLMRYLSPERYKGTSILMLDGGKTIWVYFSFSGRVRQITRKSQKMMGDFTYEDMSMVALRENYTATMLGTARALGHTCHKVKLTPKGESSYSHIVIYIDSASYFPYQIEYFKKGKSIPSKKLLQKNVKKVKGYYTPYLIIMRNLEKNSTTTIRLKNVDYNKRISDSLFDPKNLGK